MSPSRLTIVRHAVARPLPAQDETVISTDELKMWLRSGRVLTRFMRWHEVRLLTDRVETLGRPLPTALAARLMSRGACYAADASGRRKALSAALLARWAARAMAEPFLRGALLRMVEREVSALEAEHGHEPPPANVIRSARPLYIRADVSFGLKAGGSVAHTAGVVNHLGDFTGSPLVMTTDRIPTLAPGIEAHAVVPDEAFWGFRELPAFVMNRTVARTASEVIGAAQLAFVYQRYTLNGYAAVRLARARGTPLVTEYNGSEVWVARHWGQPLAYEALSARIERLNLLAAHLVSVVSRPLAREVEAQGVDPARVLVNPNGVDPDRYHPDVDGSRVRAAHGLTDAIVIGFIGTFGPWHGAGVLAEAFVRLLAARPALRGQVKLLWIGDGVTLPRVRQIVDEGGAAGESVFTGLVPQEDGAAHLAACDILVSPHVPNADGSPFFGSPTKLFEYMAMGRAIVASALDQIADVLEHERTGLLVRPDDAVALASGLARLAADPELRARLGRQAREAALARHTWRQHVRRTVDALETVTSSPASSGVPQ